jgi:glucose/arabinose dehydrogenase
MRLAWCCLVLVSVAAYSQEVTFAEPFPGLTFTAPIELLSAPGQSNRLFLVQQNGIIKVFPNKKGLASAEVKDFLNLSSKLVSGGERGLLGMAFHPQYLTNGYFYVHYTRPTPLTSVIARYTVKADNPNEADPGSELILFTQSQPYDNHNGGKLAFGNDGYLYVSIGDGGSGGDPQNYAQNLTTLLGKILRIDVDNPQEPLNYGIPADNPFRNNTEGYREEIYAYGLRNVWKFSIDPATGNIWAADVGQSSREEINLVVNGGNYGWRLMEGTLCYNPSTNCNPGGLIMPVYEYPHANNNRSITGGYVYRGIQIPEWQGHYVYGDYVSGRIWKLIYQNNQATNELLLASGGLISSFGEDQNGELYVLQYSAGSTGKIFRFFPTAPETPADLTLINLSGSDKLTWIDQSNNELGFIIERSPESQNSYEVLDTVIYNTTEYTVDLGGNPTEYIYRLKAYNDGGESDYAYTETIILSAGDEFFNELKIYPNPSNGIFTIEFPGSSIQSDVRVFDLMKREVFSACTNEAGVVVELNRPARGFYLVEIRNSLGSAVKKIIIR